MMREPVSENTDIREAIADIKQDLAKVLHMLKIVVREKHSDKLELLLELAQSQSGRILDSRRLERELGCSRPWVIKLMEKAAVICPNVRYLPGDAVSATPARIIWQQNPNLQQFQKLQLSIDREGQATMGAIMSLYAVNRSDARLLAENFCLFYPEYHVVELPEYSGGATKWEIGIVVKPRENSVNA